MMVDIWQQLQSFMGRGGPVLWVILALLVLMWILMIERLLYLNLGFGPLQRQLFGRWQGRSERHSWHAKAIRSRWLAEAELELNRHLIFIRTLVVLCMEFRGYQGTYLHTLPPPESTPLFAEHDSLYWLIAK